MLDFVVRTVTLIILSLYCRVFRYHLVRVTPEYLDSLLAQNMEVMCTEIASTARKGRVVIVWCE